MSEKESASIAKEAQEQKPKNTALRNAVIQAIENVSPDELDKKSTSNTPLKKHSDKLFTKIFTSLKSIKQKKQTITNTLPTVSEDAVATPLKSQIAKPSKSKTKVLAKKPKTTSAAKKVPATMTNSNAGSMMSNLLFFGLNLLITLLLLGGLVFIVVGIGVYNNAVFSEDTQLEITNLIPYPAGIVDSEVLTIAEFRAEAAALNRFYAVQTDSGLFTTYPVDGNVQDIVWERFIQNTLMQTIAAKYDISISNQDVQALLDEVIVEAGSEDNVAKQIAFLYGWDIETFAEKVIRPFLLREALASQLFRNDDLRESKQNEAEQLRAELIADPNLFENYAKLYSDDRTTAINGGDLGFFAPENLSSQVRAAIAGLDDGQITPVITTQEGFEIIKLVQRIASIDGSDTRINVRRILLRYPTFEELLAEERERATIYRFVR